MYVGESKLRDKKDIIHEVQDWKILDMEVFAELLCDIRDQQKRIADNLEKIAEQGIDVYEGKI